MTASVRLTLLIGIGMTVIAALTVIGCDPERPPPSEHWAACVLTKQTCQDVIARG